MTRVNWRPPLNPHKFWLPILLYSHQSNYRAKICNGCRYAGWSATILQSTILIVLHNSCQSTFAGVNPLFASEEQRALKRSYICTRCGGTMGTIRLSMRDANDATSLECSIISNTNRVKGVLMATYVSGWITGFERKMVPFAKDSDHRMISHLSNYRTYIVDRPWQGA